MTTLCPHCGCDVEPAQPVAFGNLSYDPVTGVHWHGARLPMKRQCHLALGALMRAAGRPLSNATLADIVGYEGDNPNHIHVLLTFIRRALAAAGAPIALSNLRGIGTSFEASRFAGEPA